VTARIKLANLSICPCGYPMLDDSITLGSEYEVDLDSIRGGFEYICGGCGSRQQLVEVVNASQLLNPNRPPAPLPLALFRTANAPPTAGPGTPEAKQK
jgi:hypothetical protein